MSRKNYKNVNRESINEMIIFNMEDELISFIEKELEVRGWSWYDLGREADIATGTIYNIRSGTRGGGRKSLTKIAKALKIPAEKLFRLAGLLPPDTATDDKSKELLYLYGLMPERYKDDLLEYARIRIIMLEKEGKITEGE